jgi:hypothetical protein
MTSLGSQVDHMIRRLDYVHVMLDQQHGVAGIYELIQPLLPRTASLPIVGASGSRARYR